MKEKEPVKISFKVALLIVIIVEVFLIGTCFYFLAKRNSEQSQIEQQNIVKTTKVK